LVVNELFEAQGDVISRASRQSLDRISKQEKQLKRLTKEAIEEHCNKSQKPNDNETSQMKGETQSTSTSIIKRRICEAAHAILPRSQQKLEKVSFAQ